MAQRRMSRVAAKAGGASKAHQQSNDFFSLKLTANAPENGSSKKGKRVQYSNHPFSGANLLFSFREGIRYLIYLFVFYICNGHQN